MGTATTIRDHPVSVTIGLMIAAFGVVCTVYLSMDSKHHQIQEERLNDLKERIVENESYREKWHAELTKRTEAEVRLNECMARRDAASQDLDTLRAENWEQRYRNEAVACEAVQAAHDRLEAIHRSSLEEWLEQRRLLSEENTDLRNQLACGGSTFLAMPETLGAFDSLLASKRSCEEEREKLRTTIATSENELKLTRSRLVTALSELDRIRASTSQPTRQPNVVDPAVRQTRVESLITALGDAWTSDRVDAMAHGLIALNAPITGKELSRLLGGLQGTNRVHGIQIGALFVEFPIPSLEMNEVLRDLSGSSRKDASNALMQAQATRRPGTPPYPSGTRFNWPE